jgi:hypothetical protein
MTQTLAKIWMSLPTSVRSLAAKSFFEHDPNDAASRLQAEVAIARTLKARDVFVRRMPEEKKIAYLATAVRPDEVLASSLLLALHLAHRRPMLAAFLDALGIPHDNGLIAEDADYSPPDASRLGAAAKTLYEAFPEEEVTLYLQVLLAMDDEMWGGLAGTIEGRRSLSPR